MTFQGAQNGAQFQAFLKFPTLTSPCFKISEKGGVRGIN
jgi:hypothetical protein